MPVSPATLFATALFVTSAAAACGGDKNSSAAGAAGTTGTGTAGSTNSGTGGSNGSTAAGFDAIWKRTSASLTYIETTDPTAAGEANVDYPSTHTNPVDGRQFEVYQQFESDTLVTYALFTNDTGYYRITQPAFKSEDTYVVQNGTSSHVFDIKDGVLVSMSTENLNTAILYAETLHAKHEGTFPPVGWPSRVVQAALPEGVQ